MNSYYAGVCPASTIWNAFGTPDNLFHEASFILAQQLKLLDIGRQLLTLQAIPISNPDPAPKRQYQKRKTHGKADARGLTGAEIAQKELKTRETQARKGQAHKGQARKAQARKAQARKAQAPKAVDGQEVDGQEVDGQEEDGQEEDGQDLIADTPPRQVPLPIRSPEALRSGPSPIFRLFPAEDEASVPPASTAPARLAEDQGRGKRKRASTAKYEQSVKDGLLKGPRK